MRVWMSRLGILLIMLMVAATCLFAQATSSLHGVITDNTGGTIPRATVTLVNISTGSKRTYATGSDGSYHFLDIPPGTYTVSVTATGFRPATVSQIHVLIDTPATANFVLQVGARIESVVVSAAISTLNTQNATVGNAIQERQITQLPIDSRNVVDLLSLQTGVVYLGHRTDINTTEDTRSGSVNGSRSDQTTVTLDGVDVSDQNGGLAFNSVLRTTPDSLQEFRVVTSNPTAASDSSAGAQVALVTKSGTNNFHGSAYYYIRNTATSANDYFIKLAQGANGQPNKAPKLNRNIFGASIGGPLKHNRAFFFVNYEGRRDREEQSVVTEIPTGTLRNGEVLYPDAAGTITTVTASDFTQWDPLHIGPNSAVLNYFNSFPLPNDKSVGDGLNFAGFRFAAPISNRFDVYIARFDYRLDASGNHSLFWRGSMQNDYQDGAPYLPGLPPETVQEDRGKGFVLGYTAVLKPNLVNQFRWGLTRASLGNLGDSAQPYIALNNITEGITRTGAFTLPVNDLVDNLSWIKGRHTLQFGTDVLFIRRGSYSLQNSFSQGYTSTTYVDTGGFATLGSPFDPGAEGFPAVSPNFTLGYDQAAFDVLGIVSHVDAVYNYDRNGKVLQQGAPIRRNYALNEFSFFAQDAFNVTAHLTLNFGLRYQLESPPWETNGLQVSSGFPLGQWLNLRASNMEKGIPSSQDPPIQYVLGGKANNGPPFYNWDYHNFAPRVSIAYSPSPKSGWLERVLGQDKTAIRAGFAIAYDHFGMELPNTFDQNGAFGLSTTLTNPLGGQSVDCAPRVTDLHTIPVYGCASSTNGYILLPPPPGGFPQTPPIGVANGGFGYGWSLDQGIKTPYVYMLDLSVQRAITPNLSLEMAYVGRLSHRLLEQEDFATPMNLVDPNTGVDYFSAISRLSELARQNVSVSQVTPALVGPTAPYWNLFSPLTQQDLYACQAGQCTPVQAAYDMERHYLYNETFIPFFIDAPGFLCPNSCSNLGPYTFYDPQFFALYGWRSIGTANYNAFEITIRKHFSKGLLFDLNYTFSKSLDLSSNASRVDTRGGVGNQIVNSWSYKQLYGVSDFDMTHQFNLNWVWDLPFGRGKLVGRSTSGWLGALIDNWQLSGLYRITTGLPFEVNNGINLPTDGANAGYSTLRGPVQTGGATKTKDGRVLMFPNQKAAFNAFEFTFPGQSGTRNPVRGDGYLGWDTALSKTWTMPYNDHHSVQFRWEVFNVGNFTRFDVRSNQPDLSNATNFGTYTGLLSSPRVMQFALRYDF